MKKLFKVVPLDVQMAEKIRTTLIDNFGNKVIQLNATGKGPCRVSLQPFEVGIDERLLFSYSPFEINNAFNQNGPIFIHAKPVKAYQDIYQFLQALKLTK